ncbi:MAG: aldo/keto reductase [Woeseiaceae bacterium]|nr:aldo/keto reductase [Woeseiaceae bacterium]
MINRRRFIQGSAAAATIVSPLSALASDVLRLPRRPIPGTEDSLPVIGLGNSNAFRQGDVDTSKRIIRTLTDYGGSYIDCGGQSRFVVGNVVSSLDVAEDVFLGTYFTGADDANARAEAARLLEITGKPMLDLMHNYPEDAAPNWDTFRGWKDEGLTRYIGVSRHRKEAYPTMMEMMKTGTVDVLQVNYSPLETEAEDEILPLAMDKGVAVTINRPFINGRFFQVVSGHDVPEWAAEFDCESWAQFSLKFILSHPAVHCVLTETTNPRHAVDNIGAGFGRLPDEATRQRMVAHLRGLAG